ncbi:MAG: NAD-dependent epimerase/dehydratase family protein, partial [Phycisphaerales bacterium]
MTKKTALQINELRQTPTGVLRGGGSLLITGGAGFIGSNLCEFFLNSGYEVTCLDNLSTGFK